MALWPDRNEPPHPPEWSSSSNVADTGEIFGIADAQIQQEFENKVGNDAPVEEAQMVVDKMNEIEIEMADREDDLMEDMPASTC